MLVQLDDDMLDELQVTDHEHRAFIKRAAAALHTTSNATLLLESPRRGLVPLTSPPPVPPRRFRGAPPPI